MAKLYNLARMTTATVGTGTLTLGAAVSGWLTFALAGVQNGDVVDYAIKDGANSEIGTGTYTSAGTTLTRTVTKSTNSDAAISLSGNAEVYITPRAETYNDASLFTTGTLPPARLSFTTAEFNTALSDANLATVATSGSASDLSSGTLPAARLSFTTAEFNTALSDGNLPTAAAQSDQETATSTTTFVSPGRQQYHPSAAKCWCKWGVTTTIDASYNMSSITDNGTGDWTLNINTDFSSANYAVSYMTEYNHTSPGNVLASCHVYPGGQAAGTLRVIADNINTTGTYAVADQTKNYVAMFGDQA